MSIALPGLVLSMKEREVKRAPVADGTEDHRKRTVSAEEKIPVQNQGWQQSAENRKKEKESACLKQCYRSALRGKQ